MYTRNLFLIILGTWFCSTQPVRAQQLTVGTYNIRYDNPRDSGNLWLDRAPVVANLIRFHDFDILGTQEGFKSQLDYIGTALPQYARSGVGRDDGKDKGEHSQILYKKALFKLIKAGDFWLSQNPEKPSLGWDATCCRRICSWVYLQHIPSGKNLYVFNAHYDHQGAEARRESSKLILKKVQALAKKERVVFTGDLNGAHNSEPYLIIANSAFFQDTYKGVAHPYASSGSFNAFTQARSNADIIDHIFITRHFAVTRWGVLTDTYNGGKFPSDHYPVLARLSFK